mmetsp:Transcript_9279/g.28601  ORF Transcript_9279/g.28601 Transcript_9279/m.28601 type:complete len:142 (+) Transcript_9279:3-428(+)
MTTCNTLASDWSHKFDVLRTNTACHADSEHWVPKHEAKPETLMCCLCKCSHWRWECGPFDLPHDRVHSKGGLFDLAHDRLDPKGFPHESRTRAATCRTSASTSRVAGTTCCTRTSNPKVAGAPTSCCTFSSSRENRTPPST